MKRTAWFASIGLAVSLAGCGGGGATTSSSTPTRSASLGVYVTDGFREDFSQVFITLFKVEVSDGTQFRTVFEQASGKVINASALANVSQLLSRISVPEGNYTQARITLGDHITLVSAAGGASTTAPIDDSVGVHTGSQVALTINTTTQVTAGGASKIVVDFDLPGFELVSGRVRPHVRGADDTQFQHSEKEAELKGTVSSRTAQGFDLMLIGGQTTAVLTTASTSIFSSKTGAAATLANGQTIEVKGSVDSATLIVTADRIQVEEAGSEDHSGQQTRMGAQAEGTVVSINADAKSFLLTLKGAGGFQPTGGTVTIVTTSTTAFERHGHGHDDPGSAGFGAVTAGAKVEAFGSFDSATQTLTAQRVEVR